MFQVDPERSFLSVDPASIVALYQSVNQVQVLVPGRPAAPARAVVVGYRRDGVAFTVDVALHLPDHQQHVVYSSDGPPLDAAGARSAAEEAIGFLESMGFFLEKIGWKELGAIERLELLARLKVFQPPPARPKQDGGGKVIDPRAVLARVLTQI